jgi:hypothetical protein
MALEVTPHTSPRLPNFPGADPQSPRPTLVLSLVEQNYKSHCQRQDFTVRLSQVTSVTDTASFIHPVQNSIEPRLEVPATPLGF